MIIAYNLANHREGTKYGQNIKYSGTRITLSPDEALVQYDIVNDCIYTEVSVILCCPIIF